MMEKEVRKATRPSSESLTDSYKVQSVTLLFVGSVYCLWQGWYHTEMG